MSAPPKRPLSPTAASTAQEPPIKKEKSAPRPPARHTVTVLQDDDYDDDTVLPQALAPKPPTRPIAGRPTHKDRGIRTDSSMNAPLPGLIQPKPPHTPKAKKKADQSAAYSPFTSKLLSFTTGVPIHLQESPKIECAKKSKSGHSKAGRLGLNTVRHIPAKGWTSAGHTTTFEAYRRFEQWKNDYSPQNYGLLDCVDIVHAGNPFDRPKDIRARPVMFCWNTPDHQPPEALKNKHVPVFRAKYKCSGHCRHGQGSTNFDSDSDSNSDSESDDEDNKSDVDFDDTADQAYIEIEEGDSLSDKDDGNDSDVDVDPSTDDIASLNRQLNSGAKAKAEVYSDNLNEIHFFQRYTHPEALEKYLDTSHYIRQCMLEMASLFNLPPSSIKRRLLATFQESGTPAYRRPNASQVNNVVNYIRRKDRVLSDPLLSIGVFAELNPDKIFCYTPPNYETDPPSEFATGIHNAYGTQVLILHSQKEGVGHDSTHRNMNENRAPLTIVITLDENGRMVPGFAYLSADIKIPNQVEFLRETKRLVEKMAADLVAGSVPVAAGLEDKKDQLMAQAKLIVKYGWQPAFFMIDKSRAAKGAIEIVFPGVPIRICQFHVMQAILRWERDNAPGGERQPRPTLSLVRKHMLLQAVRELQRCRHIGRWPRYTARFRLRLDAIAEGSATDAQTLWDYFEANWFCDEWRDYWTDMGLPAGSNRERMLSTNNWTERAFKTFNQVFLGNRSNKSAYRLVLILANEWFQYYQAWPAQKRVNQEALDAASEAYRVWTSTNAIQETKRSDGRRAWRVARLPRVVRG